ncbi:S8 family serine peptidase [Endozoicomonas sp. SESOKO1]|uniref:S8 family serine peptidase n=1 Tax=Endozoicomonas sp. SESOKO1 TaxID=2828742 RepID=UPI0021480BAD|nr:S8 family serine peptidase [Endozoicomonas sp. SESOKO1]
MINNHHFDRSYISFDNHLSPSPTCQGHIRERSPSKWSIYRVAKVTLTALGLLFSTQQPAHASERRQLSLQSGLQNSLQNRNTSRPPECDISPWLTSPPVNMGNASPVTDVFRQHNGYHSIPAYLDSNESGQADIDDILPDLKHLFDQTVDQASSQKRSSATRNSGPHVKPHHQQNPKEHNARTGWLGQLLPRLSQCIAAISHETSQDTFSTSTLNLLTSLQPSPIVVAVIDTGIIPHTALNDRLVPGYDFISDPECARDGDGYDGTPTDEGNLTDLFRGWHGTEIAGIIAGTSIYKDDVSPLQNIIKIQPIRYLGHNRCAGTDKDLINALKWASGIPVANVPLNTNPAKVINLSLGGEDNCIKFKTVCKELYRRNITVIASAGNEAMPASNHYPSNCPHVIAVGEQLTASWLAPESNYGPPITISAIVGQGVITTSNTGKTTLLAESFTRVGGTSTAAALVSQAAALMHSVNSRLTPDDIRAILMNTSRPFQRPAWCYILDSCIKNILNMIDTVFSTKVSIKRCTKDYCGSGHLDIGKAAAFAAGQALEESGNQSGSEFQWTKDLLMIIVNLSLTVLIAIVIDETLIFIRNR